MADKKNADGQKMEKIDPPLETADKKNTDSQEIDKFDPPFGSIWIALRKGLVVPFLGAGASLGSELSPPSGGDLSERLANLVSFPSPDRRDRRELAKVASYYEESNGRDGLREVLQSLFSQNFSFRPIHRWLAELNPPPLIITTNYDDLIESAFIDAGREFHLVVHPTDNDELLGSVLWWPAPSSEIMRQETKPELPIKEVPNKLPLRVGDIPIIYKIHGSIDRKGRYNSFVISEDDYVDFLARMTQSIAIPSHFALHLRRSRFLFLGYGLSDWNFRLLLRSLPAEGVPPRFGPQGPSLIAASARPERRSWAINYKPSRLDEKLWNARGVNIYNSSVDEFEQKMRNWIQKPENLKSLPPL